MFKVLNGSMSILGNLINSFLGQRFLRQPVQNSILEPVEP